MAREGLATALLIAVVLVAGACGGSASEEPPPTPTSEPTPTLTPLPTREPGARWRWGYDPQRLTGLEDPSFPVRALPDGYRVETVARGLERPVALAFAPDGRLFVAEQAGRIRVIEDGVLLPEPWITVGVYFPDLDKVVELGLTGIAVHPEFETNGYVYFYYTADNPRRSVVARARDEGGRGVDLEELLFWEQAPECCHVGGGMEFAPDGTLYLGVGDHQLDAAAQNPANVLGTIVRLNEDGTPADDAIAGPVFAYGLRNPYDVAIDPETGRVFAGENGFFGQDAVIEVREGANYGWPGFGQDVPDDQIARPLTFYHQQGGLAGMTLYRGDALREFDGDLFFCRFTRGTLHRLELHSPSGQPRETILDVPDCSSGITSGPDGLYYLDFGAGVVRRITAS